MPPPSFQLISLSRFLIQAIDNDGAFLRPVMPALLNLYNQTGADMAMVSISGIAFGSVRSTEASLAFFEYYLTYANHSLNHGRDNELVFNDLSHSGRSGTFWCRKREECNPRAPGVAAIAGLPGIFENGNCYNSVFADGLCSDGRLFMHSLCGTGRPWKEWSLRTLGLWFIEDSTGNKINKSAGCHQELLNCPPVTAWSSHFAS